MEFGKFIVFEGIDGCGKTTIAKKFYEYLCSQENDEGKLPVLTCEPYKEGLGKDIRNLLNQWDGRLSPKTEVFLFEAARAQHMEDIIVPSLEKGKTVICDRFTASTSAYQGRAMGGNESDIGTLNNIASGNLRPDITFWIDTDIKTCMLRNKKADSKDRMPKKFYEKCVESYCRTYYLWSDLYKKCWFRIDGNASVEEVLEQIVTAYNSWLNRK